MNTIAGIILSMLAGAIAWALVRFLTPVIRLQWGLRGFWIVSVAALLLSIQLPSPWDFGMMGIFSGAMVFEHLCQRYLHLFIKAPPAEGDAKPARSRSKRRTGKDDAPRS